MFLEVYLYKKTGDNRERGGVIKRNTVVYGVMAV